MVDVADEWLTGIGLSNPGTDQMASNPGTPQVASTAAKKPAVVPPPSTTSKAPAPGPTPPGSTAPTVNSPTTSGSSSVTSMLGDLSSLTAYGISPAQQQTLVNWYNSELAAGTSYDQMNIDLWSSPQTKPVMQAAFPGIVAQMAAGQKPMSVTDYVTFQQDVTSGAVNGSSGRVHRQRRGGEDGRWRHHALRSWEPYL